MSEVFELPEEGTNFSAEADLRRRAEAAYKETIASNGAVEHDSSCIDFQQTLHELHVHQIELEMQNDELRKTQLDLQLSRARYHDLFNSAPVGYLLVDSTGHILEVNRTFCDWLGNPQQVMLNQPLTQFIVDTDQDTFYFFRKLLTETREPQSCEFRVRMADSNSLWVQASGTAESITDDNLVARIVFIDVSERKRIEEAHASLEAQLRESQKMEAIGTLAGGIAHDFNNFLAAILANSELASHYIHSATNEASGYIAEIQKAAERARDLVSQILSFSRRQPTDRRLLDLGPVIDEAARLLRATFPARISLTVECDASVPHVFADPNQIEQVVINIASNAMHAMNAGSGHVHIRLDSFQLNYLSDMPSLGLQANHWKQWDQVVRLTICDDGIGIEPQIMCRIFEPFFTTKPTNKGTGLGLAVVHGIVRTHGGEIAVESVLGQGATFTVYLPAAKVPYGERPQDLTQPDTSESVSDQHQSNKGCRILFVDDDKSVLDSLRNLLTVHGFTVCAFSDQDAALEAIRIQPSDYDVVVTDYNMPGLSGLDVARRVREIRHDLPVVVSSGFIDDDLRAKAREAGVKELIPKPFDSHRFCKIMREQAGPAT